MNHEVYVITDKNLIKGELVSQQKIHGEFKFNLKVTEGKLEEGEQPVSDILREYHFPQDVIVKGWS